MAARAVFARARLLLCAVLVVACIGVLASCSSEQQAVEERGTITTSDAVILAQSESQGDGFVRMYPQQSLACQLVGSRYAGEASEGIENRFAEELSSGSNITLSIDSVVQQTAEQALEGLTGTVVVMDPETGALLAVASSPVCDLNKATEENADELNNRATELHIPGSTFKTITLAAALEGDVAAIGSVYDAPSSIAMADGSVSNYGMLQYDPMPLSEAYAKSVNTVFAQLSLQLGTDAVEAMAKEFGFGQQVAQDIDCDVSSILNKDDMTVLGDAWCGVGQALIDKGETTGPVATVLQMASVAAVFANGGKVVSPYAVVSIEDGKGVTMSTDPRVLNEGFISSEHRGQIVDAMREAVVSGTAVNAAVSGVDVYGKTGTAETERGEDDGWFCGCASAGGKSIAVAVMIENATSPDACSVASSVIPSALERFSL